MRPDTVGASTIASADLRWAWLDCCWVVNVQPAVWFTSVSVKVLPPLKVTLAVSESPPRRRLAMRNADWGYISKKPLCLTVPFRQVSRLPICSTVLLPSPSIPAKDAKAECSLAPHGIDGSVHVVDTLVNGPPVAA